MRPRAKTRKSAKSAKSVGCFLLKGKVRALSFFCAEEEKRLLLKSKSLEKEVLIAIFQDIRTAVRLFPQLQVSG